MNRARWIVGLIALVLTSGLIAGCALFDRPPTAAFVVVYDVTADPLVVDLDASSSTDPNDDAIAEYLWTFGDDAEILTPLAYSKLVTVPILRVRYPTQGEYTITLFVRDERGTISKAGHAETIVLPNTVVTPTP
jgi:hypothetical protein